MPNLVILTVGNEDGKYWIKERVLLPDDPEYPDVLAASKIAPHTVREVEHGIARPNFSDPLSPKSLGEKK